MPIPVLAAIAGLTLAPPSLAFECPEPQAAGRPCRRPRPGPQAQTGGGAIQESGAEIDRLSDLLRAGDLDNRLQVIARDLKDKYASADQMELTNFMVSAYCPVVAEDRGLSDSEKDARLAAFSQQVWDFLGKEGP
jgi:hypothetical protein